MVKVQCKLDGIEQNQTRFSRKDVRQHTGWTDFQVRTHLGRLVELEYVLTHRGGRGQSFVYELLYNGEVEDSKPFLSGLIDVESLEVAPEPPCSRDTSTSCTSHDKKNEGQTNDNEGALSVHRATNKPLLMDSKNPVKPELSTGCADEVLKSAKEGIPPIKNGDGRNRTVNSAPFTLEGTGAAQ